MRHAPTGYPSGRRRQCLRRSTRADARIVGGVAAKKGGLFGAFAPHPFGAAPRGVHAVRRRSALRPRRFGRNAALYSALGASPLAFARGRLVRRSSTLRVVVEVLSRIIRKASRASGPPSSSEGRVSRIRRTPIQGVSAVRSGARCGASRNRMARPTENMRGRDWPNQSLDSRKRDRTKHSIYKE